MIINSNVFEKFTVNNSYSSNRKAIYRHKENNNNQDSFVKNTNDKNKNWTKTFGLVALGLSAITFAACFYKGKNTNLSIKQKLVFESQMSKFKEDIDYRKNLLKNIGIKTNDYAILRPIVGPKEYKSILKDFSYSDIHFSPGKKLITDLKDNYDLSGKENKTFRANMHMHTVNSDGKLSVQELLDKSVKYADEVAKKIKNSSNKKAPNAPFTIAITDHDTVEGCKQAVNIISKDPWKYRNLRVILGCELSVENKSISKPLKKPISIHMLLHAINPFDENLNKLLENKKTQRIKLIKQLIEKGSQKLKPNFPDSASKLSYEDSKGLYSVLKHGQTHVDLATKDYIQFRTIFSEFFEKNKPLQDELIKKGIKTDNLNYLIPKQKYMSKVNGDFGSDYWKKYLVAFNNFVSDLTGNTNFEVKDIPSPMKTNFYEVQNMCSSIKPEMNLTDAYIDIDDAIKLMKNQKDGYMGIAHPALINMGNFLVHGADSKKGIAEVIKNFKQKGGNKALFLENHYHYYGGFSKNEGKNWVESIKNYTKDNGLLNSGGLDNHGKNIFYSGR